MGQKTHPTGFRTGVNKSHNAIWFANYGAYSKVLEEDYQVRKFFEKKFESIYSKAGIAKLEIQRKVNQLELIIHAARPKAIAIDGDKTNLLFELKDNLKFLINDEEGKMKFNVYEINQALSIYGIADGLKFRVNKLIDSFEFILVQ